MTAAQFTVAKLCGNQWCGYLFPGQQVEVERVIVNTVTGRSRADVWHPRTLWLSVPVGSIAGLKAAVAAGEVRMARWVPSAKYHLDLVEDDE